MGRDDYHATERARRAFMDLARELGSRDRADGDDSDCFSLTEVELLDSLQAFQDALTSAGAPDALAKLRAWLEVEEKEWEYFVAANANSVESRARGMGHMVHAQATLDKLDALTGTDNG